MEMRDYYMRCLKHLETPEFVRWFEGWNGDESAFPPEGDPLLDLYWSERRYALMGWHAALMPNNVSADRVRFIQSLKIIGTQEKANA